MRGASGVRRRPSIPLPLVLTTIWIAGVSYCQKQSNTKLVCFGFAETIFTDHNGICRVNSPINGAGSDGRASRISSSVR
jgi:hypothetical protein